MTARQMAQLWFLLAAIEDGTVTLTAEESPADVYAGNVTYRGSDGSAVVVFNDCNSWDYLDSVTLADGTYFDFDAIPESYRPEDQVARDRYGIPDDKHTVKASP